MGLDEARRRMVSHHAMARGLEETGAEGVRALLGRARCIQLDPLDRIGTNADLVAHARVDGLRKGDVYRHLLPGHAFEHFAKERCLLPAEVFGAYRAHAVSVPWWRATERQKRVAEADLAAVKREIEARGPVLLAELEDRGRVRPIDWSGWVGTSKAATMATEVLWRRCEVVVHSRQQRGKRFSAPAVSLGAHAEAEPAEAAFGPWALGERLRACGLLSRRAGPWWSTLSQLRTTEVPDRMVGQGRAVEVRLEGDAKTWLADPAFVEAPVAPPDERMRIVAPLDPLIWNRDLVEALFGFTYVWEVYKPAARRRWGWYVCPLLHRGRLVGRVEARVADGRLVVDRVWREGPDFDERAFEEALGRLAVFLGVDGSTRGPADTGD